MKKEFLTINKIPAVLWGEEAVKVIIAVHGNMSHKTDLPIEVLAEVALKNGYQVLSFDLPEHGDRKSEEPPCKVQPCVKDLDIIMQYAKDKWNYMSLFANSMGAYFSLLSFGNENLERAWFLSPVVDMQRIIENMMTWFQVSEEQLKLAQEISTPIGQKLYWDYYCYVKERPISKWKIPTDILYGSNDDMCEIDTIQGFTKKFSCNLEIVPEAEHYFHTPDQMQILKDWLEKKM